MPSKSVKMAKVMSAIAHGWKPSKGSVAKIPKKVAVEFHAADAGHKYGKGHHAKRALHIARAHAKKKADGGEVGSFRPEGTNTPDDDDKAAAITIHPVDPNEGLTQDLTKKSPIEGMDVPGPSLSAHQDTPREKMTNWLAGPDTKSYEPRSVLANKAMNVLDFTPPMMAEQAGEDLAKGEVQNAALFAMPGVKKAKGSGEFAFSLLHAAENPLSEYSASNPVAKKLKEQYGKDLAAASIEYGYTPEQIDNIKTYMTPGAQANFNKHYNKMAPQVQPAPWNAPEVQSTKPPELKTVKTDQDKINEHHALLPPEMQQFHNEMQSVANKYGFTKQTPTAIAPDFMPEQFVHKMFENPQTGDRLHFYPNHDLGHNLWEYRPKIQDDGTAVGPYGPPKIGFNGPQELEDFLKPKPNLGSNFGGPINMDNMSKVSGALGSNPGGVYQGASGAKYYIKQGQTPDHVKNEEIAASLYEAAGVPTLRYHQVQGDNHIATAWANKEKDNAYQFSPEEKAAAQKDFAVHAWLANHDVVGTGGDNLGMVGGKPTALDLGGALEYRAQGSPKGKIFGNEVGEVDSMRGKVPGIHAPDAAHMFGEMGFNEIRDSAMKVMSIPDQKIKDIVAAHGGDPKLADKLIARKEDLGKKYGISTADPNYIEKFHQKNGKDIADEFEQDPFQPLSDEELEEEFGKSAPTMDEGYHSNHSEDHSHDIKGDFSKWKGVEPYPVHTNAWGGLKESSVPEYRQVIRNGILGGEGSPNIVQPIQNFSEWRQPTAGEFKKPKFLHVTPEEVKKLGFNPKLEFVKGTDKPEYPQSLDDPKNKKFSGYTNEQAIFLYPHDDQHPVHSYGGKSKPYVLRADPNKAVEVYWPALMGEKGQPKEGISYHSGVLKNLIEAGHQEGIQIMFIHGMSDMGKGNQTQVLVLDTKGTMRGVDAKFNPEHLKPESPKARYPLAGIAGTALGASMLSRGQDDSGMKRGGQVAKKDKDPEDHEFIHFAKGGLIDSDIPGRTDKIPMKVAAGSYVLPADIPSALGQGNTKAGSEVLKKMFTSGPYGLAPPKVKSSKFHFDSFPSIGAKHKAEGGKTDHVPIIAAGGEYVIHPDVVKAIGHGDMAKGHSVLDKFVLHARKEHIKTLRSLKPPKP